MNQELRHDLVERLNGLCLLIPEMRVGQLMAAVGEVCLDLNGHGLWDATDEELNEALKQFQHNYEQALAQSQLLN